MPAYSQSPRLLKGAIVTIDPAGSGRDTIVFQYNSETLKPSLEPQILSSECDQQLETLTTRHQTLAFMGVEPGDLPMIDKN